MTEPNQNSPATVPDQPEAKSPLKKGMPIVVVLVVIIALIGVANVSSLLSGNKKAAPASAMTMRPASPNAQQVNSFSTQQQVQAQRDAEERQHQQELAAAMQQLQAEQSIPGPEAAGTQPMTAVAGCDGTTAPGAAPAWAKSIATVSLLMASCACFSFASCFCLASA